MKKLLLLIVITLLVPRMVSAQLNITTDSISTTLDEVVVTADTQIETAKKVILRPTKL